MGQALNVVGRLAESVLDVVLSVAAVCIEAFGRGVLCLERAVCVDCLFWCGESVPLREKDSVVMKSRCR